VKSLDPVNQWEASLKQEGAQDIIDGAKGSFCPAILLRSVWTRHVKCGTLREKERAAGGIVKFSAIIALNALDGGAKLRVDISKKIGQGGERIGLQVKRESPDIM